MGGNLPPVFGTSVSSFGKSYYSVVPPIDRQSGLCDDCYMTKRPPSDLKQIFLIQFLEPDEVLIKEALDSSPYSIFKSELWPYPDPTTPQLPDNNWHYRVAPLPPDLAGTDPQTAYEYTFFCATEDETYSRTCIQGEKVIYIPDTHARGPGHIYSDSGLNEHRISGCCEYHFDNWFREQDIEQNSYGDVE